MSMQSPMPIRPFRPCLALTAVTMLLLGSGYGAAAPSSTGEASEPKDFVVFLGLNVSVDRHGKLLPVVRGSDRDVVVRDEGENVVLPRREVALSATVEPKLSRLGVTIDALTGYPVHSPATNPEADAQQQMMAMQNIEADRQEASEAALRQAEFAQMQAGAALQSGGSQADLEKARAQVATATSDLDSVLSNPEFGDFLPGSGRGKGGFDGFEVSFRVSAAEPHDDAYGVLRLLLQDSARSQESSMALHVFRMRSLDATPRKVVVRRFGLPPGFHVASYDVHVYVEGQELATTTSPSRVEVTDDEAHQFLILRHMQSHPGATLPPQVAADLKPEWPDAALAAQWSNATVTVSLTEQGTVAKVDAGAAIASPLPASVLHAVSEIRFLPALVKGRPAASSGAFALGELFQAPRRREST